MPSRLLFSCAIASAVACSPSSPLKLKSGGGLTEDPSGALEVDASHVPILASGCTDPATFLRKSASGWACAAITLSDVSDVGATTEWPGTVPYARVTGAPAVDDLSTRLDALDAKVTDLSGSVTQLETDRDALTTQVAQLQGDRDELTAQVQALEAADCPRGFTRDASVTDFTLCTRTLDSGAVDEMVRVGNFWIDRYELSVCGGDLGTPGANDTTAVGCSVAGVVPQGNISWFQADRLCANAGKHLCSNGEWSAAVLGTVDPGPWPVTPAADVPGPDQACAGQDAGPGPCNTCSNGIRKTGLGTQCRSRFGAEDMIGNSTEWVADWSAGFFAGGVTASDDWRPWPDGFQDDGTHAFDARSLWDGVYQQGQPAPLMRGGRFTDGRFAGAYAVNANLSAADHAGEVSARCCL